MLGFRRTLRSIPLFYKSIGETEEQSHVITPAVNGTMQHGRRDASEDRSKKRRGLVVNRTNGNAVNGSSREVKSKSPRPSKGTLTAPRLNEGRKSPRRMSPEPAVKPFQEESLMPPPKPVIRRRSPRRPSSPEAASKSRVAPSATETRRLDGGQMKARSSAARSPVAETVSKPSTSAAAASTSAVAASTKRRSGVVKEVEKMQMIDDYKEDLDMNPLQDGDPVANNRITVCIRKRPLSSKEEKAKDVDVVTVASRDHVTIHEPKTKVDLTKFLENQQFRLFLASNAIFFIFPCAGLIVSLTTLQATR